MLSHFTLFQPNAWDNSIAPIDAMHKIINNLNEIIDEVNNINITAVAEANTYTDTQVATLNESIDNIESNISGINATLTSVMGSLQLQNATINAEITNRQNGDNILNTKITAQINSVNELITSIRLAIMDRITNEVAVLNNRITEEVENLKKLISDIADINIIDGFTGEATTLRKMMVYRINQNSAFNGTARYRLQWSQILDNDSGWLSNKNTRLLADSNYFAPTWHNFMIPTFSFSAGTLKLLRTNVLNTWGAFSNVTLLYIASLVHSIMTYSGSSTTATADNFKNVDCYNKAKFDTWLSGGSGVAYPTIEQIDVTTTYDDTNTYLSYLLTQFKKSLSTFTGFDSGYGLYSQSATSTNTLFAGANDIPQLVQLMLGNLNLNYYNNYL